MPTHERIVGAGASGSLTPPRQVPGPAAGMTERAHGGVVPVAARAGRDAWHDVDTQRGVDSWSARAAVSTPPRYLCFTLLYHPDLRRVGARVFAAAAPGGTVSLSRLEPTFAPPGSNAYAPLCDPHVSRKPHLLTWRSDDTLTITPAGRGMLIADGEPVDTTRDFPPEGLRAGIVLEISRSVVILVHKVTTVHRAPRYGLVGNSDALEAILRAVTRVADLQVPVLLRGETGVGKERVARAIHEASPRAGGPWLAVNMAALAPTTAASELFGHARGAFTGAHQRHTGLFERANGGTLFLDEIGDMATDVQAMLLRTLETGTILPLGETEPRTVDVRVIAATDVDLENAVAEGRFRAPLLHRLQGYTITVPPLRKSREDIPRLLLHFLQEELARVGELARLAPPAEDALPWFPRYLMVQLVQHGWPGNVRQLRNVARQLVISSRGSEMIVVDESLERMLGQGLPASRRSSSVPSEAATLAAEGTVMNSAASTTRESDRERAIDEDAMLEALRANGWSIGRAAAALSVPRTTLYRLIERSPRIRKATDVPDEELTRCRDACGGDLDAMSARLEVSKRGLKLRLRELGASGRRREEPRD